MYISAYSTYIQANTPSKDSSSKISSFDSNSFKDKLNLGLQTETTSSKNLPVDYTKKSSYFHSKLQEQERGLQTDSSSEKYIKSKTLESARRAYQGNSKLSFIFEKENLLGTQKSQENIQVNEKAMYKEMVNTYIQNDNYYKITA